MKRWIKIIVSVIIFVLLDQLTKMWAVSRLKDQNPIELIKNILELRYLENTGAAFGVFQNKQWMFILITGAVIAALLYILPNIPNERRYRPLQGCLSILAAGAIGNLIDRVTQNYVVDFIYFKLIDFPIFNVADIYVTVSTVLLVYLLFAYYSEEELERIIPTKKG